MSVSAGLNGIEVFTPIDGGLYSAPVGTTLPTSATTALNNAFVGHGYWSSDGLTESGSTTTSEIRAFQNNALVANPVTSGSATVQVALLQKNPANAALFFGDEVDVATGGVRWRPGVANGERSFVIDKIKGDHIERTVIGRGEVTATGDRVTVQGGAHVYPLTISVYDDSAIIYDTELKTA